MDGMYAVDASSVPFNDLKPIVYPDATVWRELTASRKERFGSKDMRLRGPAEKKIDAALKSPTQLEFVDTPLTDVIDYLKDYHQIEIQLDKKAMDEAGIGTDVTVTKNLKGVSLRSAMRLMLHELGLTYLIQDEVLLITTTEAAETKLSTRVYSVADLVIPIKPPSFTGGFGGMGGIGGMGGRARLRRGDLGGRAAAAAWAASAAARRRHRRRWPRWLAPVSSVFPPKSSPRSPSRAWLPSLCRPRRPRPRSRQERPPAGQDQGSAATGRLPHPALNNVRTAAEAFPSRMVTTRRRHRKNRRRVVGAGLHRRPGPKLSSSK